MTLPIKLKKGESFVLQGQYVEDDGITPKPLTGVTLSSQVRDKNNGLVATLTVSPINSLLGTFSINAVDGTHSWPEGILFWDLKQTVGGVTSITETAQINVERSITQ